MLPKVSSDSSARGTWCDNARRACAASNNFASVTFDAGHALPADGPQSLGEVARQAMLKAERDLIIPTLRRVHWNRRKAAPLLGISYKTLLNKIKEQGIVQD